MSNRTANNHLIPAVDCFVSHPKYKGPLGRVTAHKDDGRSIYVEWGGKGVGRWHPISALRSGFRPGHVVQDRPKSNTRKPLGTGTVVAVRRIANRDMVLVQWHSTGESRWIPYEHLIRLRDVAMKYARGDAAGQDSAARFRLKALAYALDSWNQVTGALDRLDVDPLPHQIDLVHRIMTSDQSNWLIADDVGLGKTIEVGLLLAAMKRRRQARRVLVVSPAGVVRQWQDEMKHKFSEDFFIYGYGYDFSINQISQWSSYDKVIVSIDRAKSELHSPKFIESGEWDVIVFDEAHHLSKIEGQAVTQRYQLAEHLQKLTDCFIFLTGTPHQGKTDQFVNLLLLLRPDLQSSLLRVFTDPSVVADVVLRNRKSLVTDANGNFLFKGQDTNLVKVSLTDAARDFDQQLQTYLRNGYDAALAGGNTGRAIGFVMTTYRKLASSSIAAIERALLRRSARLRGMAEQQVQTLTELAEFEEAFDEGLDGFDTLEDVADEITASNTGVNPFFLDEQTQITSLLDSAKAVRAGDRKLEKFLTDIADPIHKEAQQLLIFTEYRATQDYLVEVLERRYPGSGVVQINGSMSLDEKRASIEKFNSTSQFMVSTEAGGEGINLHQRCHILVNYDLPWNPRRLVQRAGRLYRYGQQERVIVFNLMADDGFDSRSLNMMLDRVYSIAKDMADVGSEFQEGLETEIIGELLERVDIASILASNKTMDIKRSAADIEGAIIRAKEAKTQQERLFSRIEGYDPQAASALYTFGQEEVLSFLEGILPYRGVHIRQRLYNGRVLELELPEDMRGRFSEFPSRATVVRVTIDRQLVMRNFRIAAPMDFASPFFLELIEFAKSPEFNGEYACIPGPATGTLGIYKIRWQNDQGIPRWEVLLPIFLADGSSSPVANPSFFGSVLTDQDAVDQQPALSALPERQRVLKQLSDNSHAELANRCTIFRHPNDTVLLAAADMIARKPCPSQ